MQLEQFAFMPYGMHSCMAPYILRHIPADEYDECIPRSITVTTITFSPDSLLRNRFSPIRWASLPSSAGIDPDRTDAHAGHAKGYALLCEGMIFKLTLSHASRTVCMYAIRDA